MTQGAPDVLKPEKVLSWLVEVSEDQPRSKISIPTNGVLLLLAMSATGFDPASKLEEFSQRKIETMASSRRSLSSATKIFLVRRQGKFADTAILVSIEQSLEPSLSTLVDVALRTRLHHTKNLSKQCMRRMSRKHTLLGIESSCALMAWAWYSHGHTQSGMSCVKAN